MNPFGSAVYKAQCKTAKIAWEISNGSQVQKITKAMCSLTSWPADYLKPPYCLRLLKPYRNKEVNDFRNLVAKTTRERRKAQKLL